MDILNGVKIFGSPVSTDSTAAYAVLIIFMALLLGAIVTLLAMLILSLRNKKRDDEADEQLNDEEQAEEIATVAAALPDEESVAGGVLGYNRSFTAKYIQSSDEVKQFYVKIKNELLAYKKVDARMSWKRENFFRGRKTLARLTFRGKTLCLYLALDPAKYADGKYAAENAADVATYADTPLLYRIRSDRHEFYAAELIAECMREKGIAKTDRPSQDYYLPYEGVVELIDKGLIKRVIRDSSIADSIAAS